MSIITLAYSTNSLRINQILQGVVSVFEQVFPDRIRGYYLRGSHHTSSSVLNSDLDLYVIFKEDFHGTEEIHKAVQLCESCVLISPVLLEIAPGGENRITEHPGIALNLKLSTQLLYGEDIRDRVPMPSSDAWVRWVMHSQISTLKATYPNNNILIFPLDYPDPQSEFYGYDWQTIRYFDGSDRRSTKSLVATVCWIATALIAFRTGDYVGSKGESVNLYKTYINDEWNGLVEQVYEQCRNRWNYAIPDEQANRFVLQSLCQRTLGFSNHFLNIYRSFLLHELHDEQIDNQLLAVRFLERIIYPDDREIVNALKKLQQSEHEVIRRAAYETEHKRQQSFK